MIIFLTNVYEIIRNLVLNFQTLDVNRNAFLTQYYLQIFVIFTIFVEILTSDAHKNHSGICSHFFFNLRSGKIFYEELFIAFSSFFQQFNFFIDIN